MAASTRTWSSPAVLILSVIYLASSPSPSGADSSISRVGYWETSVAPSLVTKGRRFSGLEWIFEILLSKAQHIVIIPCFLVATNQYYDRGWTLHGYSLLHCCTELCFEAESLDHPLFSPRINIRYRLVQRSRLTFSFSPIWKKRTILYINLILCTYFWL